MNAKPKQDIEYFKTGEVFGRKTAHDMLKKMRNQMKTDDQREYVRGVVAGLIRVLTDFESK